MAKTSNDYGILVAVDGSAESDAAVRWAAEEAVLHDLAVTLMHVVAPVVAAWPIVDVQTGFTEWQRNNADKVLEKAQQTLETNLGARKLPGITTEAVFGQVVQGLVDASRRARMVVVGSRGMGRVGRAVLGSVSSGVLHHAHCPVAIVHAHEAESPGSTSPVLLGVDGSPASEAATAVAFDEASRRGVELVALHAWSDVSGFPTVGVDWRDYEGEGYEALGERLAGWQEQYPDVPVRRRIEAYHPARWLLEEAQQAQLVVVGSHGRGGFTGMLLGSVSTAVAEGADAPVIVVRGDKAAVDAQGL